MESGQEVPNNGELAQEQPTIVDPESQEESSTSEDEADGSIMNSSQDSVDHTHTGDVAPAREHSYLPGTSHPLFPENLLDRRRRLRSSSFARLSIEGTNKRVRNSPKDDEGDEPDALSENSECSMGTSWREEYRHLNAPCHRASLRLVELPILELNGVVLFPGSTLPIRLRNRDWIEYLGRKIDATRGIRGVVGAEEEVRMGIITYVDPTPARVQENRRQRRSWVRSAIVPRRGSQMAMFWREYERLLQESLEDRDTGNENEDEPLAESSTDESPDAPLAESSTDESPDAELGEEEESPRNDPPPQEPSLRRREEDLAIQSSQQPSDPLIGRIGTMATITCTHEDAAGAVAHVHEDSHDQHSSVWHRNEGQLVVTALGT